MGRRLLRIFAGLILLAAAGFLPAGSACSQEAHPPRAENGLLDLRTWDFDRQGSVALDGQWAFAWRRFDAPWKTGAGDGREPASVLDVPFVWNDHPRVAQQGNGFGYATYRLRIRLPDPPGPLALHVIDVATACTLYADGRPVYRAGTPGATRAGSRPGFKPGIADLEAVAKEVDLVAHVSNFHHRQGGMWDRIMLGRPAQIHALREGRLVYNMILFGSLLLIGLYHLGLYGLRRDDPAPLYFGLACLAITLRTLTTGERYLVQLFPTFPFEWLSKLEYWGFYISLGCFALFARYLFPHESDRRMISGITGLSAGLSLLVLLTPLRVYSYTTPFAEGVTLLAMGYGLVILRRALAAQRTGAAICLAGFLVLLVTTINDILYSRQILHTFYMVQFGLLFLVLSQAFLLSLRFSELFGVVAAQRVQLKVSEEKYRQLVENANEAIFILQNGLFKFVNPRTETLFGYSDRELRQLAFIACVQPDDRAGVETHLVQNTEAGSGLSTEVFRLVRPSGKITWVQLNAVPTTWEEQPAQLCFLSDVSGRKQSESRWHRLRKYEALALLASGLAQEFNESTATALRNMERATLALDDDNPAGPYLKKVTDACLQARQIVAQLLIFGRKSYVEMRPLTIASEVERAVGALTADASSRGITVQGDIAAKKAVVLGNEEQIRQLLGNLVTNAFHAMDNVNGVLQISLREITLTHEGVSRTGGLKPGKYVRLTVTDNGCGIPEEIQDRIFDPYFTTKAEGEAKGTGLSIVMGIVKLHNGDMGMVSAPGTGATFHVFLPTITIGSGS